MSDILDGINLDELDLAPVPPPPGAGAVPAPDLLDFLDEPPPIEGVLEDEPGDPNHWRNDVWEGIKNFAGDIAGNVSDSYIYRGSPMGLAIAATRGELPQQKDFIAGRLASGLQGLTLGHGDEIVGTVAALGNKVLGPTDDATFAQNYVARRDLARGVLGRFREEHPLQSFLTEAMGAVVGPGKAFGAIGKIPTGLGRLGAGVGIGGLEGAVAGAGYSDAPAPFTDADLPFTDATFPQPVASSRLLDDTATGAAIGAGVGLAAPAVAPIVEPLARGGVRFIDGLRRLAFETPEQQAQRLIQQRLGGREGAAVAETLGQLNGQGMLADTSDDARRLLRSVRTQFPKTNDIIDPALDDRQLGMVQRLDTNLDEAARQGGKVPAERSTFDILNTMSDKQRQATAPLYGAVNQSTAQLNDNALSVLRTADGKRAYEQARRIAEAEQAGDTLPPLEDILAGRVGQLSGRAVDYVKQGLDSAVEAAKNERSGTMQRAMSQNVGHWLKFADEAIPGYPQARQTHAAWETQKEALELGSRLHKLDLPAFREAETQLLNKLDSLGLDDATRDEVERSVRDRLMQGAYIATKERLGTLRIHGDPAKSLMNNADSAEKIRYVFDDIWKLRAGEPSNVGQEAYEKFLANIGRESEFARTRQTVQGGSQTMEKVVDAAVLGRPFQPPTSTLGLAKQILDLVRENVRQDVSPAAAEQMAKILTQRGMPPERVRQMLQSGDIGAEQVQQFIKRYTATGAAIPMLVPEPETYEPTYPYQPQRKQR